ncbi:MAG: phage scaffolding protein [Clostridium sp.]|nr:phage scaffolding protein [Clostridium sp.]
MEWLQKILANAVYGDDGKLNVEATMKKINEEAAKHIVAKEQYNTKVKELDTANDTIKDLKKSNGDNEELQKTIKAHEDTIKQLQKDHEAELKGMKIDSAITKILADNKAKHPDLLAGKFDREKLLVTDDGKVTGLDDQLKGLKETYKDMFTQTVAGREPNNPDSKPTGNTTFESLVNSADTMTAEEVAAQFAAMETK